MPSSNTEPIRQKQENAKAKMLLQLMKTKQPAHKCTFDMRNKCWVGPVKSKNLPSKWCKARGAIFAFDLKIKTSKPRIDVDSLVRATRRRHLAITSGSAMQKTDSSFVSLPSKIDKPFYQSGADEVLSWTAPVPIKQIQERSKDFSFDRPKTANPEKLSSAVNGHQAAYMKKIVAEKEKEIKFLQSQLLKANTENVKLINELKGYRGKNYDAIHAENEILKEYVSRVSRENIVLRGQLLTESNRILNKRSNQEKAMIGRRTKSAKPVVKYH